MNRLSGYVANIPMRALSDSEGDTSSGEEKDETFPKRYFQNPLQHFRLYPSGRDKRGSIRGEEESTVPKRQRSQSAHQKDALTTTEKVARNFNQTKALLRQLTDETFDSSATESRAAADERLRVVIGVNKMRSVSRSRNRGLQQSVHRLSEESSRVKITSFFWEGVFQERNGGNWKTVPYERILDFYRQFKKDRGKVKALAFVKDLESSRAHLVPYRAIRETISRSHLSASSVHELREKKVGEVYLVTLDADSISLRAQDGRGVFSHYDELINRNSQNRGVVLEVGSCGYLFDGRKPGDSTEDPIMKVATEVDVHIRDEVAKFFGYGIYYPEPSMIIRIPPGKDHIPYSFDIKGKPHYSSPQESVMILNQVREKFNGSQDVIAFNASGAVVTTTPSRAEQPFAAHYDKFKKIVRWTERDLKRMRGVSQSHFHPKKRAEHLLRDFDINESSTMYIGEESFQMNSRTVRLVLISLISRLFSHYDVVFIARERLEEMRQTQPVAAFPRQFIEVLENYDPDSRPLKQKIRKNTNEMWDALDQIASIEELKAVLENFISKESIGKIHRAAKESGKKVLEIFKSRFELDFPSLSKALMQDYIAYLQKKMFDHNGYRISEVNELIINSQALTVKEKFTPKFSQILLKQDLSTCLDNSLATPLHWAAIMGDRVFIKALRNRIREKEKQAINSKSKENQSRCEAEFQNIKKFFNLHAKTKGGAMPFHCALKYCADHANDLVLLESLIDKTSAEARTSDGMTPLVLALNELENPGPVVELICRFSERYGKYKEMLVPLLNELHPIECREAMLLTLLYHLPNTPEADDLLKQLIKDGIEVNGNGFILREHNPEDLGLTPEALNSFNIESIETFIGKEAVQPIRKAIKRGNTELITLMLDKGLDVSELDPETTHTLRHMTGRRNIMCEKDRDRMFKKQFARNKREFRNTYRSLGEFDWYPGPKAGLKELLDETLEPIEEDLYPSDISENYNSNDEDSSSSSSSDDEDSSSYAVTSDNETSSASELDQSDEDSFYSSSSDYEDSEYQTTSYEEASPESELDQSEGDD